MKHPHMISGGLKWAMASLIALAGATTASADDATLNRLEIRVNGVNILGNFNKSTKNYEIELGEDSASIATFSAAPSSASATSPSTGKTIPTTRSAPSPEGRT